MKDKPAFPVAAANNVYTTGMTLRQYAAIHAPIDYAVAQQLMNGAGRPRKTIGDVLDYMAKLSATYADTLLAELEKGQSDETN